MAELRQALLVPSGKAIICFSSLMVRVQSRTTVERLKSSWFAFAPSMRNCRMTRRASSQQEDIHLSSDQATFPIAICGLKPRYTLTGWFSKTSGGSKSHARRRFIAGS